MTKITVDKALIDQAINALSDVLGTSNCSLRTKLRAALAEPAVEQDVAYKEAKYLAEALFQKHYARDECYASGRVEWGLCDSTAGIISQIDNMVSVLVRPPANVPMLTQDEISEIDTSEFCDDHNPTEFARAIESLVRQKAGLK